MMLKMKAVCEKCNAPTAARDAAYICSFECTFCESCNLQLGAVCPNCSGELLRRPKRLQKPLALARKQLKQKLFGR